MLLPFSLTSRKAKCKARLVKSEVKHSSEYPADNMQNDIFTNTASGKAAVSGRTNNAQDKTLQDELMQELAQHKTSLQSLASDDTNASNALLSDRVSDTLQSGRTLSSNTLRGCVEQTLHNYFSHLDGQAVSNIYEMVLSEVEAPLLEVVMRNTMGNQCKAAELLGLSRGTLRKKLQQYGLL